MLQAARKRMSDESGFTLIELLAVILIIGILAAIALTTLVGHKDRAEDADAKALARNLVTHVESCFAAEANYTHCDEEAEVGAVDMHWGSGPDQTQVTDSSPLSFEITAYSNSSMGGTRHTFVIAKDVSTGVINLTCAPTGQGGCPETGRW
ncbi:MAG TPA: type II secretion system protein [Thermoleophilaceae bacterium]|jgi:type IV pilus assembly protein PilA